MFRQLGQSPPESEMKAMIDAVDADSSGTVDFEEFCLLMLRMKRAAITPSWLLRLFVAGSDTDDDDAESAGRSSPSAPPASLSLPGSFARGGPTLGSDGADIASADVRRDPASPEPSSPRALALCPPTPSTHATARATARAAAARVRVLTLAVIRRTRAHPRRHSPPTPARRRL